MGKEHTVIASVILNAALVVIEIVCVILGVKRIGAKKLFGYFTVLSNVLCGISSAVVLIAWISGSLPLWVILLKFVGTAAVTVTLLTVFLFLGPTSGEWKLLLSGPDLFMHLFNPLIAIVSLCFFEHTDFAFPYALLGVLPVVLYGVWYVYRVVLLPEDRRMEDFYGFNKRGKWPVSCVLMFVMALVISVVLWAV